MMATAITYRRKADGTRIVYVFEAGEGEARRMACTLAPHDFRLVAVKRLNGERMNVPQDGDDYGTDAPTDWWRVGAEFAEAGVRGGTGGGSLST